MSDRETLFNLGPSTVIDRAERTQRARGALIRRPVRNQFELPVSTLDDRVPAEHPVRAIVAIVESLDLSEFEALVNSNAVGGGRPAVAPSVLLALWIYATSQGESSASEIARRVETDDVYRWICGGISASERALAHFRARSTKLLERVLAQVIGSLMSEGLIDLHRVAQDGTRVRTWCGADSFRRQETLEKMMKEASAHVRTVMAEANDPTRSARAKSAAIRGAKQREERISRALERVKELGVGKSAEDLSDKKKAPRVSATDPEATRMKMPDGGFRPGFNVQFATTADGTGTIVGVEVTNRGNDFGEIEPMLAKVQKRTGVRPAEWLVDGGYLKKSDVESVEAAGTAVFAPAPKSKASDDGRTAKERSPALTAFYARIESEAGRSVYAQRGQVAELANAHAKTRFGMIVMRMRGIAGATVIALMTAVTNDVLVLARERAAASATFDCAENPAPVAGA